MYLFQQSSFVLIVTQKVFGLLKLFPDLTVDLHSTVTYPQVCRLRSTAATLVY